MKNSKGTVLKNDILTIKNLTKDMGWYGDVYSSGKLIAADTYTYVISNNSKASLSFKYNIEKFDRAMTNASIKKTIKVNTKQYQFIKRIVKLF